MYQGTVPISCGTSSGIICHLRTPGTCSSYICTSETYLDTREMGNTLKGNRTKTEYNMKLTKYCLRAHTDSRGGEVPVHLYISPVSSMAFHGCVRECLVPSIRSIRDKQILARYARPRTFTGNGPCDQRSALDYIDRTSGLHIYLRHYALGAVAIGVGLSDQVLSG